jgi:hypothetical protein
MVEDAVVEEDVLDVAAAVCVDWEVLTLILLVSM